MHEHVFAGVHQPTGHTDTAQRLNICTLGGAHFLLSAATFLLCFAHCIMINNVPYILIQGVNGFVSLIPFFFLPELRGALRANAVRLHGAEASADIAVVALKRGISVLSLMTFLLSEATGCIGVDSHVKIIPTSCQFAIIDNFILNHLAFLNLFDTVVVETGIVPSRTALIQCRGSIPISIRACAAGAALLTIFCIGLFSTRHSLRLVNVLNWDELNAGNSSDPQVEFTVAGQASGIPMFGWMIIQAVIFCKMPKYLRFRRHRLEKAGGMKAVEMTAADAEAGTTSAYVKE